MSKFTDEMVARSMMNTSEVAAQFAIAAALSRLIDLAEQLVEEARKGDRR